MCEHSLQLARSCRSSARGHSPASSHSARPCCTHCTSLASSCARDIHQEQSSSAQSPSLSSLSENTNSEHKRRTKAHNKSSTPEPFVNANFQPTEHTQILRKKNKWEGNDMNQFDAARVQEPGQEHFDYLYKSQASTKRQLSRRLHNLI